MKSITATAILAITAAAVAAAPASAAPVDQQGPPRTHHSWAKSQVVLGGVLTPRSGPSLQGNRHQLSLTTDNGSASGYLRSYFCPSGASVSPTWASSRCTHRGTIKLRQFSGEKPGRVSSTGLSAVQDGRIVGYRGSTLWTFKADLTLRTTSEPTDDGDGTFYSYWRDARVSGSFSGRSIVAGSTQLGYVGRYGPV